MPAPARTSTNASRASTASRSSAGTSVTSPRTPKTPTGIAQQKELEEILTQVYDKVVQLAGGDPEKVNRRLTAEGVIEYLEQAQKAEDKKSEKYAGLKTTLDRTLQCISTVGGFVASGVSNVFAPSEMCFNALTFVIAAWQGYEEMFESLAELLAKCAEFLERLDYFKNTMDSRLSRLACQNLQLFVEVCDRAIQLRSKRKRWAAFSKRLFLQEDSIQDLLDTMERMDRKEMLLVNAQNYKLARDNSGLLKLMADGQKEQKKEEEAKGWRKAIAKVLDFPTESLGSDEEPIPTWQRTFDLRKNSLVSDTGEWIDDTAHVDFLDWSRSVNPQKSVFVLEGEVGTGKTSMMANVLRNMRLNENCSPTTRAVTAYFFLEAGKQAIDDRAQVKLRSEISRTLLWQISTAYEAMVKAVAQAAQRNEENRDVADQWQKLFVDNKERLNADTTHYLFIDGLDDDIEVIMPLLLTLSAVADTKRPRIFLTATPNGVEALKRSPVIDFYLLPLAKNNNDDITKYIKDRMDKIPITQNPERRPGIAPWREYILNTLREKCGGDYFRLNNSLNALSKVDLIKDIEGILGNAGRTRSDQADSEIRRLNEIRTPNEIREINEIMMWIETGRKLFTIDEMEALISIKHLTGRSPASSAPVSRRSSGHETIIMDAVASKPSVPSTKAFSLLPFRDKIIDKYTLFTITQSNKVDWRSVEYKKHIPVAPKYASTPANAIEVAAPTNSHVVQKAEIDIVRHFMKTVCPPGLFDRLEVDRYLDAKMGPGVSDFIRLDSHNANLTVTIECLTVLTQVDLKAHLPLHRYAMMYLLHHMKTVKLQDADPSLKARAGALLVDLFTLPRGIESLFWTTDLNVSMRTWRDGEQEYLRHTRSDWVYAEEGVSEVARWLHDPWVTSSVSGELGESFVAGVNKPEANLHEAVLSHAARLMAERLFRRVGFTKQQFLTSCRFLRGYHERLNPTSSWLMPKTSRDYRDESFSAFRYLEREQFHIEELAMIEDWAAEILGRSNESDEEKSSWEIHAALAMFQLCGNGAADIFENRARRAWELNPQNWNACHFISSRLSMTDEEESIKLLREAKSALDAKQAKNDRWLGDHANSSLLARITLDLGTHLWDASNDPAKMEVAAKTHLESLNFDYVHFSTYSRTMEKYRERSAWGHIIAFIDALNACPDLWRAYFDELVNDLCVDIIDNERNTLSLAAEAENRWDVIESFFTIAIGIGEQQPSQGLMFKLRDSFAMILAFAPNDKHGDKVIEIRQTALREIKRHPSNRLTQQEIGDVTSELAETYYDRAFRPGTSKEQQKYWGDLLTGLVPSIEDGAKGIYGTYIVVCCLIRYHKRLDTTSKLAKNWMFSIFRQGIELLLDDDDENDGWAFWILVCLFTTMEDEINTRITWMMDNWKQHRDSKKFEELQASINSSQEESQEGSQEERFHAVLSPLQESVIAHEGHSPVTVVGDHESAVSGLGIGGLVDETRIVEPDGTVTIPAPSSSANGSPSTTIVGEASPRPDKSRSPRLDGSPIPDQQVDRRKATSPPLRVETSHNVDSFNRMMKQPEITSLRPSGGLARYDESNDWDKLQEPGAMGPAPLVHCDGCRSKWVVMDSTMYTCCDCVGQIQLCERCYGLLLKGELKPLRREFKCTKDHKMIMIPKFDTSLIDHLEEDEDWAVVLLPDGVLASEGQNAKGYRQTRRHVPWDEWLKDLKDRYLGDEKHASVAATPIQSQSDSSTSR